jgi:hypothetical protein
MIEYTSTPLKWLLIVGKEDEIENGIEREPMTKPRRWFYME